MEDFLVITDIKLIVINIIIVGFYCVYFKLFKPEKNEAKAALIICLMTAVLIALLYCLKDKFNPNHLFVSLISIYSISCIITLELLKIKNDIVKNIFVILLIFGVFLGYVSYTPFYLRQHDSRSFENYERGGHYGYIGYIFNNNKLPNMNPKDYWCFYNPPLFYVISTIILKIVTFFKVDVYEGFEFLQVLSALYTIIFVVYALKILEKLNIKKILLPVALFIGLSPALVIMSGSLNNDILSISLSTIALYYAIVWYEEDNLKYLIIIALAIGLAMMTKVSSALIAVVIAAIFIAKVIKELIETEDRANILKKYIIHFCIFGIISLPIGLWFPIKNLVKYDIPLTYVQSVDLDNDSNISEYSIFERLFKIEEKVFENPTAINMSKEDKEYNLLSTTIKSFLVDEAISEQDNKFLNSVVFVLLILAFYLTILFIVDLIYIIYCIINKKLDDKWIWMFLLLFAIEMISYVKFCFDYPFTFTMNFRYIIPILICFGYFVGKSSEMNNRLYHINRFSLYLFSVLSIIMFANM